jgi:hypothetical protein
MKQLPYEIINDIHASFLVMKTMDQHMIDYQYRILRKFPIKHILRIAAVSDQSNDLLYYEINSKDSLCFCLKEHNLIYPLIHKLIESLVRGFLELHEYLLEEERLDLRPEFIFYDRLQKEFFFLYLPVQRGFKPIQTQCFELFDFLLQNIAASDYRAINLAHRLRISIENERLNIEDINQIMQDIISDSDAKAENSAYENQENMKPIKPKNHMKTIRDQSFIGKFFKNKESL